jgi:hypothetical protein
MFQQNWFVNHTAVKISKLAFYIALGHEFFEKMWQKSTRMLAPVIRVATVRFQWSCLCTTLMLRHDFRSIILRACSYKSK